MQHGSVKRTHGNLKNIDRESDSDSDEAVSYTHLTLPTILLV